MTDWRDLGDELVGFEKRVDIQHQHDTNEARLKAVVEEFLLGEGRYQPSWRKVIFSLDEVDESHLANQIRSYGEPVQGESTCMYVCVFESGNTCVCVNGFME